MTANPLLFSALLVLATLTAQAQTSDSVRSLDLSGYSQVAWQSFSHPGNFHDGFSIKRARLDFQGHFSSRFDYRLLIEFASPALVEAHITYKPFQFLNIKAGQMIVAFSQENMTQDRNLDLIERSQVVNALVARKGDAANGLIDSIGNQNGRDIGIQAGGSLIRMQDAYLLDYTIQLLNGAGINTSDNNESKDLDARLVIHPLKVLSIGASYYNGNDRLISSPSKDQRRIRWGAELALNYSGICLKGEYIRGQEGNSREHPGDPGLTIHEGWYAQVAYFFLPKRLQGVFRYDYYDPNRAKTQMKSRYYDLGLNYFFNVWTKLQVYYSLRSQEGVALNNNLFETQLQLAF